MPESSFFSSAYGFIVSAHFFPVGGPSICTARGKAVHGGVRGRKNGGDAEKAGDETDYASC